MYVCVITEALRGDHRGPWEGKGAWLPQKTAGSSLMVLSRFVCRLSDGIVCVLPWLRCLPACHMSSRDGGH